MKYGKVDLGEIEALLNSVGGTLGMDLILQGKKRLEELVGGQETAQKLRFLKNLPLLLDLRDFLRGWGKYEDRDSLTALVELRTFLVRGCNSSLAGIKPEIKEVLVKEARRCHQRLTVFGAGNPHLKRLEGRIDTILSALIDPGTEWTVLFKEFVGATAILAGVEEMLNELLSAMEVGNE